MKAIKSLTIVTNQGVKTYESSSDTVIVNTDYHIVGDPYPCFQVLKNDKVLAEIRCVHNVEIEYELAQEVVEKKPKPIEYNCISCGKDMGQNGLTCPHCDFENPF